MSLCSWSAYDMHIKMAQIPFTSFTLEVLHTGIKSINVSVHACQHHNRHSESVQCTVTIMFVSVTITYRHSESVQCSHHHVCVSITDRHSVSSVQSPSCLSVSASQTGTQSQFSAVTIMSVSASQTGTQSAQCTVTTYLFCKVPQFLFPYIYKWPHYPQITFPEEEKTDFTWEK